MSAMIKDSTQIKKRDHAMPAHTPLTVGAAKEKKAASENNIRGWEHLVQLAKEAKAKIEAATAWEEVKHSEQTYVKAQYKTLVGDQEIIVSENDLEIAKLKVLASDYKVDQTNELVSQEEWKLRQEQYKTGQEYVKAGMEHDKLQGLVDERTLKAKGIAQALEQLSLSISTATQANLIERNYEDVIGMIAPNTFDAVVWEIKEDKFEPTDLPAAPKMSIKPD